MTRPVDEVAALHPLQEEHRGRDAPLLNMWACLQRKPSVLRVQTKTLAYMQERCVVVVVVER